MCIKTRGHQVVDEVLLPKWVPDNVRDNCAVGVLKEGQVVGWMLS